jgi:hypothetical protein
MGNPCRRSVFENPDLFVHAHAHEHQYRLPDKPMLVISVRNTEPSHSDRETQDGQKRKDFTGVKDLAAEINQLTSQSGRSA